MTDIAGLDLKSTYADELDGMYVSWQGEAVPEPVVLRCNDTLARSLGLDPEALTSPVGASILSGAKTPDHAKPLAMAYAGHQFGNFSQQLGDGRALLLGELADEAGQLFDLHLKGSGPTPFSRGGDGKAGIGPVLREYLVAEAMHALGVPTTRALAAVSTGETIHRDPPQPGAVLARTATSHLRVGTFQFFAARQDTESVAKLVRFALTRHGVDPGENEALALLRSVIERQAGLVALWMNLGFVHGVMNTDNTTISGETIDYGPCAFMERYDPNTVFSSIDQAGRYRYGNQPAVMQWNLARFAETLLPLLDARDTDEAVQLATRELERFGPLYEDAWRDGLMQKLGLSHWREEDANLVQGLFEALETDALDYTSFFRDLARTLRDDVSPWLDQPAVRAWQSLYEERAASETKPAVVRADAMDRVNPIYIPRNHRVEAALDAAIEGDLQPFDQLLEVVTLPYEEQPELAAYAVPAPASFGRYTTYCGT